VQLEEVVRNPDDWPLLGECLREIEARYDRAAAVEGGVDLPHWRNLSELDLLDDRSRRQLVHRLRSELIYQVTEDVVRHSEAELEKWEVEQCPGTNMQEKVDRFAQFVEGRGEFPALVDLSDHKASFDALKKKLGGLIRESERVSRMDGKAEYVIRRMFELYLTSPAQLPNRVLASYARATDSSITKIRSWPPAVWKTKHADEENCRQLIRAIVDYIAGMTDRFALQEFDQMFSAYPRRHL